MKRPLISLLLAALLLTGCAAHNPLPAPKDATLTVSTMPSDIPSEPARCLESRESGPLRIYETEKEVLGLLPMGQNLILFSGTDTTTLSLLDPGTGTIAAQHEPGFLLMPENSTLQQLDGGISYFSSTTMETVMLDQSLRQIRRIPAPTELAGFPLLSANGQTLFYCTATAIRALDLSSGISRILKEANYPVQGLSGLLLEDSVLQISITDNDGQWKTLFLSSETGQLLKECDGNVLPKTSGQHYFLETPEAPWTILCGSAENTPYVFQPHSMDLGCFYLSASHQAVALYHSDRSCTVLDLYDLQSSQRHAELIMEDARIPRNLCQTDDGTVWFLCYDDTSLYSWDPRQSAVADSGFYGSTYYTRSNPDYDGLARCTLYAQELSTKYGINILIYKDATATEPWDYHLEYEYRADLLQRELESLDLYLSHFPAGFLQTLAEKFTALNICLVRSAEGSPESGSLEAVNGIQFLIDFDAYIVLSTSHDIQYALYHELSHLMETVVLTESSAYDRWDLLNPEGFQYDNDYTRNQERDGSPWMKAGAEYFIDSYAMSYAKEDRARLFEYAMTPGHEDLFASPNLQRKLQQMCLALRDAFGLEKSQETFLWEQYLQTP